MGFFDDDPFDDIVKEFFGGGASKRFSSRKFGNVEDTSNLFVEGSKFTYLVLDLSGKRDINVDIKDHVVRNRYGEKVSTGKKIVISDSIGGEVTEYALPKKLKTKDFQWNFNNGILEVKFKK